MVVGIAWNAGTVRGQLLGRRRLGAASCRDLAARPSLEAALADLGRGPYADDVTPGMTLAQAQWAVLSTPLWHLRILAGWLPPAGAEVVRTLASWWEVHNVENLLADLRGRVAFPAYDLGRLDTAWDRFRDAAAPADVVGVMRSSPWGDPDGEDAAAIVTRLRVAWAERVDTEVEAAGRLAAGWAVLQASRAGAAVSLRPRMARDGDWVRHGQEPTDQEPTDDGWRAEVRWWREVDEQGRRWLRRPREGVDTALGAFCALLADAHRVQGALALAAGGGTDEEAIRELL